MSTIYLRVDIFCKAFQLKEIEKDPGLNEDGINQHVAEHVELTDGNGM